MTTTVKDAIEAPVCVRCRTHHKVMMPPKQIVFHPGKVKGQNAKSTSFAHPERWTLSEI